jgi:hypothetical protein
MLHAGLGDAEIGLHYGCTKPAVWKFRKVHGLPAGKRGGKGKNPWGLKPEAAPTLTRYTDEHGRTVTLCPAGYARGTHPGPTAKGSSAY